MSDEFDPSNFLKKDMIVTRPSSTPTFENEFALQYCGQFDGGQEYKSPEHIDGQNRLEMIFIRHNFITKQEDPVWCFNTLGELKQYQVDVMVMTLKNYNLMALEVDKYGPKQGKRKGIKEMAQRDGLISQTYKIPVVRFDVDCLKEGRKKTEYYMSDNEIFAYSMGQAVKWYKNNAIRVQDNTLINL